MARGKQTFFALVSDESNLTGYTISRNKANIGQGERMKVRKYDKNLRKHVDFYAKPIKKAS